MGRVRRTASPALRAYMPRAHINAPPLLRKTCTRASRIAVFRLDFDARVHVLGEALCGFESLARCRKKPEPGDQHGLRASMAEREGVEAPLRAAVRCGRSRGLARFAGKRSAFPQLRTFTGFEFLIRCRKNPHPKGTQAWHSPWRRERDSNPRDAHAPNGFQDRRIQPLCHLSVVGNDSIEYRPA